MSEIKPAVLVVDDTEANLQAFDALLSEMGCEVVLARSGNAALRLLLKRDFAVILLDVQMPEMDGYEVARHARSHPSASAIPIIFVTATHREEEGVLRGYQLGAVDFLFKPVRPEVLRGKVRVFLDLYRARRDLAEAAAANERLIQGRARERAEAASRAKSRAVATVAHELRNPLGAVINLAEVLQSSTAPPLADEHRAHVDGVLEGGRHMLRLVEDLLDLAQIEAGKMTVQLGPTPIGPVIERAHAFLADLAARRGVEVVLQPCGQASVTADPLRLLQVVRNLLSNAIKFTPRGGRVEVAVDVSDPARTSLRVRDNGSGIHPDDMPRLFAEFEQLASSEEPASLGTGLGLSLTRRLVELQRGTIEVASEVGRGSTFTVRLHRAEVVRASDPEVAAPAAPVAAPRVLRILIVEDEILNRTVLRAVLKPLGADVHDVETVAAATDALDGGLDPDLVIADLHGPDGGGMRVLQLVRGRAVRADIPIVAISGSASKGQRERLVESGFDGFVEKPVDAKTLRGLVVRLAGGPDGPG